MGRQFTGSLISSVQIMFSTTCQIIVLACVPERAADLRVRSSAQTIHLFDSGGDDLPSYASLGPGFFIT
jgi:hypothetical protein